MTDQQPSYSDQKSAGRAQWGHVPSWSEQAMKSRAEQEARLEGHRNAGSPTHQREALAKWEGERYQQDQRDVGGRER